MRHSIRAKFAFYTFAIGLVFTIQGCFGGSDDDNGEDLDVEMEEPQAAQPPAKITPPEEMNQLPKRGSSKSRAIPASAVVNWQQFFKPPPTNTEREALETKLLTWRDSESPEVLVKKGHSEMALGRLRAAEVSYRKALRLDADNIESQLQLAGLYIKKGEPSTAFEFLSKLKAAINVRHDIPQSFIFKYRYTLALGYIERGDRAKGHKVLSDLIGVEKTFIPAYVSLATSYIRSNRQSVAEFVVRRGMDQDKESPALLNLMGAIALSKGKDIEAQSWFDKALASNQGYSPALINRATLALTNQEFDTAEQDLNRALLNDPNNVEALVGLGLVQRKQGRVKAARASLTKAVDLAPENPIARFNLGVLMADDLKRPNIALRLFHEVVQSAPNGSNISNKAAGYIQDIKESSGPY